MESQDLLMVCRSLFKKIHQRIVGQDGDVFTHTPAWVGSRSYKYAHECAECGSKLFRGVLIWSDHGICTLDFLERVCGDLLWGREDMVNKSKEIIMGMVGWYGSKLDMLVNWICEASKDSIVARICGNVSGFVVSCCLVLVVVDAVGRRKLWRMAGNFW